MDEGKLTNYQVVTPSAWNAWPRDPWDQPGPYEEIVLNTPILEEFDDARRGRRPGAVERRDVEVPRMEVLEAQERVWPAGTGHVSIDLVVEVAAASSAARGYAATRS